MIVGTDPLEWVFRQLSSDSDESDLDGVIDNSHRILLAVFISLGVVTGLTIALIVWKSRCLEWNTETEKTRLSDQLTEDERRQALVCLFYRQAETVSIYRAPLSKGVNERLEITKMGKRKTSNSPPRIASSSSVSTMDTPKTHEEISSDVEVDVPEPSNTTSTTAIPITEEPQLMCGICNQPLVYGRKVLHGTQCDHLHHFTCAMDRLLRVDIPQHSPNSASTTGCPVCSKPLVTKDEWDFAASRTLEVDRLADLLEKGRGAGRLDGHSSCTAGDRTSGGSSLTMTPAHSR